MKSWWYLAFLVFAGQNGCSITCRIVRQPKSEVCDPSWRRGKILAFGEKIAYCEKTQFAKEKIRDRTINGDVTVCKCSGNIFLIWFQIFPIAICVFSQWATFSPKAKIFTRRQLGSQTSDFGCHTILHVIEHPFCPANTRKVKYHQLFIFENRK